MNNDLSIYKLAVENASEHIIITDAKGIIIFANKAVEKITGYSSDEVIGKTPALWGGLMEKEFYQNMWHVISVEKQIFIGELRNRRKDGNEYFASISISPIFDGSGNITNYVGIERDITEVKAQAEQKARIEALIRNIADGVVATNSSGEVIFCNTAATTMLGYDEGEFVGKKWTIEVAQPVDDEDNEILFHDRPIFQSLSDGKPHITDFNFKKKDGEKLPVSVSAAPVFLSGDIIGSVIVFRDFTREKEVDRMKTEFISLASHQLRTPLSAIKWYLEMLLDGDIGSITEDQKNHIIKIDESNNRMIDLVNALLNVSRIESGRIMVEPSPTEIRPLVCKVVEGLKQKLNEKNTSISIDISGDIPIVNVDANLISNVYMNLLTNAIKYTPPGGEIRLKVSMSGEEIVSEVSDNGYGIPEDQKGKIFNKFFRGDNIVMKETDGTGLGLYLTKAIVDTSGGRIWFESTEDKGSSFYFSIPISGSSAKKGEVTIT